MKWKNRLTKQQRKHLYDQGITTLREFHAARVVQREYVERHGNIAQCWDCLEIERRLAGSNRWEYLRQQS